DGDALRPVPPGPLAHEARGHEGGAPRAVGTGTRSPSLEDDRPRGRELTVRPPERSKRMRQASRFTRARATTPTQGGVDHPPPSGVDDSPILRTPSRRNGARTQRGLEDPDQQHARTHEGDPDQPPGRHVPRLEADPAEVVDYE